MSGLQESARHPRVKGAVAPLAIKKGADGQRLALVNQNALGSAAILMGAQLTDALKIDIHTLFLPVPSIFDKKVSDDKKQIKASILENLRRFVETSLKEIEAE
ncbi:MAG: hypothetical protein IJL24_09710 [Treponema sp.]|nr:hypothetical protein [Treponema sp.]